MQIIAKLDEPLERIDLPVADGYLPFGKRPIETLEKLRELRTQVILDYRKAKAKVKKDKKPKSPRKSKKGLRARVEAKLSSMPEEIAAILRKEMEEC